MCLSSPARFGGTIDHLKRRGYDEDTAQDATQIAWQELIEHRLDLLRAPSKCRAWLRTTASRSAARLVRERQRYAEREDRDNEAEDPIDALPGNELHWLHGSISVRDPAEAAQHTEYSRALVFWCPGVRQVLLLEGAPDDLKVVEEEVASRSALDGRRREKGQGASDRRRTRLVRARRALGGVLRRNGVDSSDPLDGPFRSVP